MKLLTSKLMMSKPAALSKLIVIGLLGALSLLLVEIRFEHREVLGEAWQSWIPLLYCGVMLALGAAALTRWHRGGRKVLLVGFAAAFLIGLFGLWFHSDGHPISGVFQVLAAWALRPGDAGGIKIGAPPVLAPLAFVGLGSMGVLACSWRFLPEQTVQSLDSARDTHSEAPIPNSPDRSPAPLLLVRGVAGFVFLLEGILKFVTPDKLGVGRFLKIGIPSPEVLAPFVGVIEIACGLLIVFGLLTRLAALPLIIDMLVAIATTKVPILLHSGFWDMAHEARLDFAMLACSCVLLTVGAGNHSIDAWLRKRLGSARRSWRRMAILQMVT